jgi:hypothetical protein
VVRDLLAFVPEAAVGVETDAALAQLLDLGVGERMRLRDATPGVIDAASGRCRPSAGASSS